MKKTISFIVMAVLCLFFKTTAQDIKISGRVTTRPDNQPLPGATVRIKESSIVALTDAQGNFSISAARSGGTIIVSYTGFKTTETRFSATGGDVNIEMEENKSDLNEVVVIGYGQTTRKLNTGSVSSISAKQIEQQPVTNVLSALSGRMPGVFVQSTNGLPGGNINIQIRGKGSILAGTNPLYIIDGVTYDGTPPVTSGQQVLNNIGGAISPLNNLNPSDIETITVLKDADATSIYGSRGANGVVLITTKKAKAGDTKLDVNLLSGISRIADRPNMLSLNDYLALRREAFANDNLVPSSDPAAAIYAPDLTLWSQTEATDWVDYLFGNTAKSTDAQMKISGGKSNTTFSVSGNYHKENTILPGHNNYQRAGLSSQFQHSSADNKLNISVSNQLSHQNNEVTNIVNTITYSFKKAPNYPLYLEDGSLNGYFPPNILAEINARSNTKTDNSITNLSLNYHVLTDLDLKINAGYTKTTYDQTLIFPTRALYPGTINYSNFSGASTQTLLVEPQINYALKLKKSTLSILVGATVQNRTNDRHFIEASNFKLESLMEDLASAGSIGVRSTNHSQYKFASSFGRINYNLMDSYILNATFRRDGSSKFGSGYRYGNFGSIGGAWVFSNLSYLKDKVPFLSYGKLRASYGSTGNDQINDYQYLSTYNSPGSSLYQDVAVVRPSRISNANFHWETTYKTDVAIELGFLQGKIQLTADFYLNNSKDQLVLYNLPQITGFANYQANLPAVIENKGWEFSIDARIISNNKFSWSGNFNISLPKNKLKSFENFQASSYANLYEIGYDISRIYGYRSLGIDPLTGKVNYAGQNNEVSATPFSNFTLGKLTPDYYGGFGNSFTYGEFELNVFTQFVKQVSKGGLTSNPGASGANNDFAVVKNRWSASNSNAVFPKATTRYDILLQNSSLNIFDTSYVRIKNVSLSYRIPKQVLEKLKINNLRLYAEGQNLITFWNRNTAILDPEAGGINIPPLKSLVLGLQLTL